MSGMNCVRKTNKQMFGWIGKTIRFFGTLKGVRLALYSSVTIVLMCLELWLGVWLALPNMNDSYFTAGSGFFAGFMIIVSALVCCATLLYAMVLWENCESDNGE